LYRRENPKISLTITLYNQEHYIRLFYASIQKQELKDIEIIFVDDASIDNSSLIIKELMMKDKRIIFLKNQRNKKQFYSINLGVLHSKGEYILSIDPDDYILNNILIKAYETAKLYDLDILQYYMLAGKSLWDIKYQSGIICQNINVRQIFYFGDTRNLPDKLIKRIVYIKSINLSNILE
jgi:glycosyltransferase involved in cell wall biosynthesis